MTLTKQYSNGFKLIARLNSIPIKGPLSEEKAFAMAKLLGPTELYASAGWLNQFGRAMESFCKDNLRRRVQRSFCKC
ncbi:Major centromere autoantigen [Trichinella pseudospiralis]